MAKNIFGPVPSRRLGLSLGIDLIPAKTCSMDCLYCECGRTTELTIERKRWFNPDEILKELSTVIQRNNKIDFLTFSGSGEPTLSTDISYIIKRIKKNYTIPVCVLTNGSLLYLDEVKKDLSEADVVIPSLDAVSDAIFKKINRPHKELDITKIIKGLIDFKKIFSGKYYIEILFLRGINDSEDEIKKISSAIDKIKPDKVQLNTNARPGTKKNIVPLSQDELKKFTSYFNFPVEIISSFNKKNNIDIFSDEIVELLKRRPCSCEDIEKLTGLQSDLQNEMMENFKKKGLNIVAEKVENIIYFRIK